MTTLGDIDHDGRIERKVRRVLMDRVRKSRKHKRLDELDHGFLDNAADAQTGILILDALMKQRVLSPAHAAAYAEACKCRDAMLAALGIKNPYGGKAN